MIAGFNCMLPATLDIAELHDKGSFVFYLFLFPLTKEVIDFAVSWYYHIICAKPYYCEICTLVFVSRLMLCNTQIKISLKICYIINTQFWIFITIFICEEYVGIVSGYVIDNYNENNSSPWPYFYFSVTYSIHDIAWVCSLLFFRYGCS